MPTTRISRAALETALQPIADAALAAGDGVLARVWLIGPGDLCVACPQRERCPDRTRCLHLVASAGLTTRLDGPYRRFPIGSSEVGRVPLTCQALLLAGDLASHGLADPTWLTHHGITGFAALPLEYGGHAIGVLAVFGRAPITARAQAWLTHVAALGALALGSLRAYRELAVERNRAVARSARRRETIALDPDRGVTALRPLAVSEREIIEQVLAHTAGKVSGPSGAAAILGLRPTTLFSRLRKLGIDRRAIATRRT